MIAWKGEQKRLKKRPLKFTHLSMDDVTSTSLNFDEKMKSVHDRVFRDFESSSRKKIMEFVKEPPHPRSCLCAWHSRLWCTLRVVGSACLPKLQISVDRYSQQFFFGKNS